MATDVAARGISKYKKFKKKKVKLNSKICKQYIVKFINNFCFVLFNRHMD